MPWCHTCDRYWANSAVAPDGTCGLCGRQVDAGDGPARSASTAGDPPVRTSGQVAAGPGLAPGLDAAAEAQAAKAPWHFWVLVAAVVVYLGWRAWFGIVWAAHQLF